MLKRAKRGQPANGWTDITGPKYFFLQSCKNAKTQLAFYHPPPPSRKGPAELTMYCPPFLYKSVGRRREEAELTYSSVKRSLILDGWLDSLQSVHTHTICRKRPGAFLLHILRAHPLWQMLRSRSFFNFWTFLNDTVVQWSVKALLATGQPCSWENQSLYDSWTEISIATATYWNAFWNMDYLGFWWIYIQLIVILNILLKFAHFRPRRSLSVLQEGCSSSKD